MSVAVAATMSRDLLAPLMVNYLTTKRRKPSVDFRPEMLAEQRGVAKNADVGFHRKLPFGVCCGNGRKVPTHVIPSSRQIATNPGRSLYELRTAACAISCRSAAQKIDSAPSST
jgi:hypothetical protein